MNVTYSVLMNFEIYKLSVKYVGEVDPHIVVNDKTINRFLFSAVLLIKRGVSKFFDRGHSFSDLLDSTPLCWLNIKQIEFLPNYGDYFIWGGFTPSYDSSLCPLDQPYGPWTEMLLEPKKFIAQIITNIKNNITQSLGRNEIIRI